MGCDNPVTASWRVVRNRQTVVVRLSVAGTRIPDSGCQCHLLELRES